jgi:hypothetical protein
MLAQSLFADFIQREHTSFGFKPICNNVKIGKRLCWELILIWRLQR